MKRLGIFGGTFNPIHLGHLNLVENAAQELELDQVLIIPTFIPPHKETSDLVEGKHRLAMCQLAVQNIPMLQVSDIELRRGGASYTYLTLEKLHGDYPDAQLFFIVGGDMLLSFRQWMHWERVLDLAMLCAAPRTPEERPALQEEAAVLAKIGHGCRVLEAPILEMSATEIRRCIQQGESTESFIAPQVAQYIADHGLYK